MAPKELIGRTWAPATILSALRLVWLSMAISTLWAGVLSNHTGTHVPPHLDQRLQKRLREINKPAVKSIQSPDGDTIDCVLFHQQPAFDHPLLKNLTVPQIPTTSPFGADPNRSSYPALQTWHRTGIRCPEGTIPIRRTSAEELLRIESGGLRRRSYRPSDFVIKPGQENRQEYASVYVSEDLYNGASMIVNIWNPAVEDFDEFSLSHMSVVSGNFRDGSLNAIESGWQVYPILYGDSRTRLFIYMLNAERPNGCYNLQCPGFVQTNRDVALGGRFGHVSVYEDQQYDTELSIWRDAVQSVWWLKMESMAPIGYWPAELFTSLRKHARTLKWGGEVLNLARHGSHTATQMGSGHFQESGFGRASYIRNIHLLDENNVEREVESARILVTRIGCYGLLPDALGDNNWGAYFYYGGPGQNQYCP